MKKTENKSVLGINEFYNINKFPSSEGMTVLGISIPLINYKQSATKCFQATEFLISKIKKSGVGAIISYSDGLYMNSDEPANKLKYKFQLLMEKHKQKYLKLIHQNINIIPSAFSFVTWSQLILSCKEFSNYSKKLKEIYSKDKLFQKYVDLDITTTNRVIDENSINYILEEVLLDYLIVMGRVRLQNDYIQDRQKWILNCYHGKPHRAHVYIYQKKIFNLKSDNIYKGSWYDLINQKLYEFDRLDIETFDFNQT